MVFWRKTGRERPKQTITDAYWEVPGSFRPGIDGWEEDDPTAEEMLAALAVGNNPAGATDYDKMLAKRAHAKIERQG